MIILYIIFLILAIFSNLTKGWKTLFYLPKNDHFFISGFESVFSDQKVEKVESRKLKKSKKSKILIFTIYPL